VGTRLSDFFPDYTEVDLYLLSDALIDTASTTCILSQVYLLGAHNKDVGANVLRLVTPPVPSTHMRSHPCRAAAHRRGRTAAFPAISTPEYDRVSWQEGSTTLPGYVQTASEDSPDLHTSEDLRPYLCPEMISKATRGRSYQIKLIFGVQPSGVESTRGDRTSHDGMGVGRIGEPGEERGTGRPYSRLSDVFDVNCVTEDGVRLTTNYKGPPVVNGRPRVYLSTNLCPRTSISDQSNTSHASHIDVVMEAPVTAIGTHPNFPHILVGYSTDNLCVLSSDCCES